VVVAPKKRKVSVHVDWIHVAKNTVAVSCGSTECDEFNYVNDC
jgi:hypothetical protein